MTSGRTATSPRARAIGLAVAIGVLLLAACSGGGNKTSTATKASTASSASTKSSDASDAANATDTATNPLADDKPALYPVKAGNQWTYAVTLGGSSGTETFVMTKITPGDGYRDVLWTVSSSFDFGLGSPSTSTLTYTYRFLDDGTVIVPAQSTSAGTFTFHTDGSQGQVIPSFENIAAGKTLSGSYDATGSDAQGQQITAHTDWTSTGQGYDDVVVPAGSYPGSAKLLSSVTLSGSGTDLPPGMFAGTVDTTQWFAKGVGLVKQSLDGIEVLLTATNVG